MDECFFFIDGGLTFGSVSTRRFLSSYASRGVEKKGLSINQIHTRNEGQGERPRGDSTPQWVHGSLLTNEGVLVDDGLLRQCGCDGS